MATTITRGFVTTAAGQIHYRESGPADAPPVFFLHMTPGSSRVYGELLPRVAEAGHRAIVVAGGGRLVAELEALGAEHIQCAIGEKHPRVLTRISTLATSMRERGVDIVHARSRLPACCRSSTSSARRPHQLDSIGCSRRRAGA